MRFLLWKPIAHPTDDRQSQRFLLPQPDHQPKVDQEIPRCQQTACNQQRQRDRIASLRSGSQQHIAEHPSHCQRHHQSAERSLFTTAASAIKRPQGGKKADDGQQVNKQSQTADVFRAKAIGFHGQQSTEEQRAWRDRRNNGSRQIARLQFSAITVEQATMLRIVCI